MNLRGSFAACALLFSPLTVLGEDPVILTVINNADKPVYATTVSVPKPSEQPFELVRRDGTVFPVFQHTANGQTGLRTILSLKPRERMDFTLREAKAWGSPTANSSASFDAATGTASLSNGLINFSYKDGKWSLAYSTDPAVNICQDNQLDYWLSDKRHGRLMDHSDEKLRGMGLLRSTESAKITGGKAKINPDGSATLVLTKSFPSAGKNTVWEETYTLNAAEPVLIYKTRWTCTDKVTRNVAYVGLGAALKGEYGPLLQGRLRFKYDIPASGEEVTASGISVANTTKTSSEGPRVLLSGKNNGFTRVSWRNERCWAGVDSELGNGLVFSTLKNADVRFIPGNTVWVISNTGYSIRLLDHIQENQPYEFSKKEPLELGFAIAATSAEVGVWNQGRYLFQNVTNDKTPTIGDACTVYLNGSPVKAGEADRLNWKRGDENLIADGNTLRTFLETDFKRPYSLVAEVSGTTPRDPLTIAVKSDDGKTIELLECDEPGAHRIDFTQATGWLLSRRTYALEIRQGSGAKLESLSLETSAFAAPKLDLPSNKVELTDIATFYRWHQVRGSIDYELQLSRSSSFKTPTTLNIRSEVSKPYYMPTDAELPAAGKWYWRVRAMEEGRPGEWSEVRTFTLNKDIAKKPVIFKPTPENPIFTMEGCRVPDWSRFKDTLPEDIKPHVVFSTRVHNTDDFIGYFRPIQEMNMRTFLRTHGPVTMTNWEPLSMVEELFQTYPNIIGIQVGETMSAHYTGDERTTYTERLLKLCGKYGRIFYDADGSYPSDLKIQSLYDIKGKFMEEYKDYLILAQKNNILHRQFATQSAVLGLYLAEDILAQGAWEDGGWYWQQVGFRKLGEIMGQRGGDVTLMPRVFWTLNFVMGLSRGCSVFSFEGQVGTMPVPRDWKYAEKGMPEITDAAYRNPAAFWTTDGELLPTFHQFCLPFMRAVIDHKLVPTREELLRNVKLAIYNDGVPKKEDGDQYYYEWESVYRGTYGFRDIGVHPGTLMEFFPNTGRYHYFPILPQGERELGKEIKVLPLSQLSDTAKVSEIFDAAYPAWYTGDALVNIVGDTLTVLNSNENLDEIQNYSVPLKDRGAFETISGKIGPHAYLLGKFTSGGKQLWLQANSEYPERPTEVSLMLKSEPKVTITPPTAAKVNRWDEKSRTLTLVLSHDAGAVDVAITE